MNGFMYISSLLAHSKGPAYKSHRNVMFVQKCSELIETMSILSASSKKVIAQYIAMENVHAYPG